jgi:ABC-type lipoprotein export system ATPase subunit
MSAKYELQDILRIRDRRKDAAETALLKAKQALREAEQFLKEQQDKGKTVVISSHEEEALEYCDINIDLEKYKKHGT